MRPKRKPLIIEPYLIVPKKSKNRRSLLKTSERKPVTILYAGIQEAGELIRLELIKSYGKNLIHFFHANSDDTIWRDTEVTQAFQDYHYDLCILWLNNILFVAPKKIPSDYDSRMEECREFIKMLLLKTNTRIVGIWCTHKKNTWPEQFLKCGLQAVYHAPFSGKRIANDFPVLIGWEKGGEGFERIVGKE